MVQSLTNQETQNSNELPIVQGEAESQNSPIKGSVQNLNQTLSIGNTSSSSILLDKKSVRTPSYSFNGDTDTGITSPGSNTLTLAVGGASKYELKQGVDIYSYRDASNVIQQQLRWTSDVNRLYIQPSKTGITGSGSEIQIGKYNSADSLIRFNTETNQVALTNGTSEMPSITFIGNTNTGFFRYTDNTIGITTGGTSKIIVGLTQSIFNTNVVLNSVVDFTNATIIGLNPSIDSKVEEVITTSKSSQNIEKVSTDVIVTDKYQTSNESQKSNFIKKMLATVLFLIWSITTIILTITIIGIIVLLSIGYDNNGWFSIPKKCIDIISY